MSATIPASITDKSAWRGEAMQRSDEWLWHLSDADLAELDRAMRTLRGRDLTLEDSGRDDFPLPTLAPKLDELARGLERGRGFVLIRGLSLDAYTDEESKAIFWGIGRHLGLPVSQNRKGELLTSVRYEGRDRDADAQSRQTVRSYQSNAELAYHSDPTDVVALLCLRPAKSGGVSTICSATTVFNIIAAERPDLLEPLFQPYAFHWKGEQQEGAARYFLTPLFSYYDGNLSCTFNGHIIRIAQELPEAPRLTDAQWEALQFFESVSCREGVYLNMSFQRGDMQFLNNYTVLHARTRFEDFPEPELRRHLIRQWITLYAGVGRKLAPGFTEPDIPVPPGNVRGGRWPSHVVSAHITTRAEPQSVS